MRLGKRSVAVRFFSSARRHNGKHAKVPQVGGTCRVNGSRPYGRVGDEYLDRNGIELDIPYRPIKGLQARALSTRGPR